jgi:hypothetical protein
MIARLLAFLLCLLACVFPALAQQEETKGVPAEPDNAAELRERRARDAETSRSRGSALFSGRVEAASGGNARGNFPAQGVRWTP